MEKRRAGLGFGGGQQGINRAKGFGGGSWDAKLPLPRTKTPRVPYKSTRCLARLTTFAQVGSRSQALLA